MKSFALPPVSLKCFCAVWVAARCVRPSDHVKRNTHNSLECGNLFLKDGRRQDASHSTILFVTLMLCSRILKMKALRCGFTSSRALCGLGEVDEPCLSCCMAQTCCFGSDCLPLQATNSNGGSTCTGSPSMHKPCGITIRPTRVRRSAKPQSFSP